MRIIATRLALPLCILVACLSGNANAQQREPLPVAHTQVPLETVEKPLEPGPSGGPALWKVADEDTTIYLFGTIHILPEGLNWYGPAIALALGQSDTLVTEIPHADKNNLDMQKMLMRMALLPDGQNLRALLDEKERAIYEQAMAQLQMPANALDRFEPWMAAINLSMIPVLQQGYSPNSGVEVMLVQYAGSDKARNALETPEYQLSLFDGLSEDVQIEFLVNTAEQVGEVKNFLDAIVAEWIAGDPDDLAVLLNAGLDSPELAHTLLYQRNMNWSQWIDNRLEEPGTVFVAVGAGHLAGEKSVLALLKQRGIESQRIQ